MRQQKKSDDKASLSETASILNKAASISEAALMSEVTCRVKRKARLGSFNCGSPNKVIIINEPQLGNEKPQYGRAGSIRQICQTSKQLVDLEK